MAEEPNERAVDTEAEEPNGSDSGTVSREEYERVLGQARRWERQSKANAEKAKKYDDLAAKSMTDAERAEQAAKRAEEAEVELAKYRRADERREWASAVSKKTGVPAEVLAAMDADSEEALELAAEPIKAYFDRGAAPVVPTAGVQPPTPSAGKTPNEWLRDSIPDAIKRHI